MPTSNFRFNTKKERICCNDCKCSKLLLDPLLGGKLEYYTCTNLECNCHRAKLEFEKERELRFLDYSNGKENPKRLAEIRKTTKCGVPLFDKEIKN